MSPPRTRALRDTQVWMVAAITGAEADASAKDVARFVTPGPRMTADERFAIYRAGYRSRLVECLLDDYPVVAAVMGETPFEALCLAYIDRHPSTSPNLNGFGRHMAAFCREAVSLAGQDVPRVLLEELATLEWALVEVLHAECPPALDVAALQTMPPEAWADATFIKSDALRVFHFTYPVNSVFIAHRTEGVVGEIPAPSPNVLAVYRKDTQLWRMALTPARVNVLTPLLEGKSLGEALASVEATVTDPELLAETAQNLMRWFREWAEAGFFARIEFPLAGAANRPRS